MPIQPVRRMGARAYRASQEAEGQGGAGGGPGGQEGHRPAVHCTGLLPPALPCGARLPHPQVPALSSPGSPCGGQSGVTLSPPHPFPKLFSKSRASEWTVPTQPFQCSDWMKLDTASSFPLDC